MRCARSEAWSSSAGFHHGSMWNDKVRGGQVEAHAAARRHDQEEGALSAWKASTSRRRSFGGCAAVDGTVFDALLLQVILDQSQMTDELAENQQPIVGISSISSTTSPKRASLALVIRCPARPAGDDSRPAAVRMISARIFRCFCPTGLVAVSVPGFPRPAGAWPHRGPFPPATSPPGGSHRSGEEVRPAPGI